MLTRGVCGRVLAPVAPSRTCAPQQALLPLDSPIPIASSGTGGPGRRATRTQSPGDALGRDRGTVPNRDRGTMNGDGEIGC